MWTYFAQALRVHVYLSPLLAMQCPKCGQKRYSRDWTKTQWKAHSARTLSYNCCKQCADDYYLVADGELMQYWENINVYMTALRSTGIQWIPLFEKYMKMPHDTRKQLSYLGAIRLRDADKPLASRAHHETTGKDPSSAWAAHYFDPSNFVYLLAMRMMWPEFLQSYDLNENTVGDIFEGILGLGYEYSATWPRSSQEAYFCLDSFVYWVYRFACAAKHSIWQCKSFEDVKLVACAGSDPTRYV